MVLAQIALFKIMRFAPWRNVKSTEDLFKGLHFEQEIIILGVRWYLRYKLLYRNQFSLRLLKTNQPTFEIGWERGQPTLTGSSCFPKAAI
jgi:hypothetical protein